jgi:hypothetical protein
VTYSIEQHDPGEKIGKRAKAARIAIGQGRERQQDQIDNDESD